jgi:flagellar basal-body rod modification protein FlgD
LLTTQLQNQNPLDPMGTNQFTQQLVQFAQVEQQMKIELPVADTNPALQQSAQSTAALDYVGQTVGVDGSNGVLSSGQAMNLNDSEPAARPPRRFTPPRPRSSPAASPSSGTASAK